MNGPKYGEAYNAGNLLTLKRDGRSGDRADNLSYTYQSGRNRLAAVSDAVSATPADWDAEDASFNYDANGNMISQSGKFSDINYEHRNLPAEFITTTGPDVYALYDANGQRMLKELSNGDYEFYIKDGAATLAVFDQSGFSHFNFTGPGGAVFGRYATSTGARYYLKDHLGSTRLVTDQHNAVLATFDYYPYGLLMPGRYTAGNNTPEKFTGKELDSNLNLYYFGARYYDASLGRWQVVDPLLNEMMPNKLLEKDIRYLSQSPYNYVHNNPLRFVDPDGKQIDIITQFKLLKIRMQTYVNNFGNEVVSNPATRGRLFQAAKQFRGSKLSVFARGSAGTKRSNHAALSGGSFEFGTTVSTSGTDFYGNLSGPEASLGLGNFDITASTGSINILTGELNKPVVGISTYGFSAIQNSSGQRTFEISNPGPLQIGASYSKPVSTNPLKGFIKSISEFIKASLPDINIDEDRFRKLDN